MTASLNEIEYQPFDYQYLKYLFQDYKYPRNKISKLLKSGELIALKQGLYMLSPLYKKEYCSETIANLLYGPSYISMDYALAQYGLIPEYVYQFTSVTSSRKKSYETKFGHFTYLQLKLEYYQIGYHTQRHDGYSYLIATPEKALCDKLYLSLKLNDLSDLETYLMQDLRIDESHLKDLDYSAIVRYAHISKSKNVKLLSEYGAKNG